MNIKVPGIIREMVTNREAFRNELSIHTTENEIGIKLGKSLVNALLYGQNISTRKCFEEIGIPFEKAPNKLKRFHDAMNILVKQVVPKEDLEIAKARATEKKSHKPPRRLLFSALSDLTARVEEQKLIAGALTHSHLQLCTMVS